MTESLVGRLPWSVETNGLGPITPPAWQSLSACVREVENGQSPDLWYAPDDSEDARQAKDICSACPVRAECLAQAMETQQLFGIWGAVQFEPQETKMCSKGRHEMTDANTRMRFERGVAYPRCLACDREAAVERRARRAA